MILFLIQTRKENVENHLKKMSSEKNLFKLDWGAPVEKLNDGFDREKQITVTPPTYATAMIFLVIKIKSI